MNEEGKIVPFLPKYLICIDGREAGALSGRVYGGAPGLDGLEFSDLPQMVVEIDKVCDAIGHPMAWQESRLRRKVEKIKGQELKEVLCRMRSLDEKGHKGNKATFILTINFRQNASWQGVVQWVEKKETFRFRSALELMRYIDQVCEEGYEVSMKGDAQALNLAE